MAGPWEKYGKQQEEGPWAKYGTQEPAQGSGNVAVDVARSIPGALKGVGTAAVNFPGSAIEVANNIGKAVLNPIDTAQSLGEVVTGGVQKLIPGEQKNEAQFDAVVDFFKQRYGSNEGLYKAITEDPAGVMADMSGAFMGGGAALLRVAPQTAQAVSAAGRAIDPINVVAKVGRGTADVGGKITQQVVGSATGSGPGAVEQALRGEGLRSKSSDFVRGMRGKVGGEEILTDAKTALARVKEQRSELYRQRLGDIAKDNTPIDLRPIKQRTGNLMKRFNIKVDADGNLDFSRSTLDKGAHGDITEIIETVSGWGKQQGDNTAIGLDILKRKLDDFYTDSNNGRAFVTDLRNGVKGEIVKAVPEYATMTKDYEKITTLTNEMERALSLGKRPMMDTAIKKLSSTMRENFGFRKELLNQLEDLSGQDLSALIAGADMNQMIPKGLVGKLAGGGVLGAGYVTGTLANPYLLSMAAISSPRVMGEFLNALGFSRNQATRLISLANSSKAFTTGKRAAAFQAGRTADIADEARQ